MKLRVESILCLSALCVAQFVVTAVPASGQAPALDDEAQRFQGSWQIVEMVENGRSIPESEIRNTLPGAGRVEIVDYTLLFQSPVDGTKSAKSFRLDPTTYPKSIAIMSLDKVTGVGVYELDKGKLVVCVANPEATPPTDFGAPKDSGRTLIVMTPAASMQNTDRKPGISTTPPPNVVTRQPAPPAKAAAPPAKAAPVVEVVQVEAAPAQAAPPPAEKIVIVNNSTASAAGRYLSDAEVKSMIIGNWRMNDTEGTVDLTFDANGGFLTHRHTTAISNFHTVFVPTPVSSGVWNVQQGRLYLTIRSSRRPELINTTAMFSIRSVSPTDAIIVDSMGRVAKVVRLP